LLLLNQSVRRNLEQLRAKPAEIVASAQSTKMIIPVSEQGGSDLRLFARQLFSETSHTQQLVY
jgi:hypothetical protein